jgi:dynein heavy chain
MNLITDFKTRTPEGFNMIEINLRIKEKAPFIVVCLQECERMNGLLGEIKRTLDDLKLGLTGALNITDTM